MWISASQWLRVNFAAERELKQQQKKEGIKECECEWVNCHGCWLLADASINSMAAESGNKRQKQKKNLSTAQPGIITSWNVEAFKVESHVEYMLYIELWRETRESKKHRTKTNKIIDLIWSSLKFLKSFSLLFRLSSYHADFTVGSLLFSIFHFNQHQMTGNKRQLSSWSVTLTFWEVGSWRNCSPGL